MRLDVERIDSRTTVTEPGRYELVEDIREGGGTPISDACLRIQSSDVVLDGAGHTVDGHGVSDTVGIAIGSDTALENVVVTNVTLSDWEHGVYVDGVSEVRLDDVSVVGNGYGIWFERAGTGEVHHSRITGNLLGVVVPPEGGVHLLGNTVESNYGGDVVRRTAVDAADCPGEDPETTP